MDLDIPPPPPPPKTIPLPLLNVFCRKMFDHIWNVYEIMTLVDIYINSNYYNLQTVNAIDFLFATLHPTPFLYVKM